MRERLCSRLNMLGGVSLLGADSLPRTSAHVSDLPGLSAELLSTRLRFLRCLAALREDTGRAGQGRAVQNCVSTKRRSAALLRLDSERPAAYAGKLMSPSLPTHLRYEGRE